jgi:hypothetical protein
VSALQNAQVVPTAVPMAASVAVCAAAALGTNLLTRATRVRPGGYDEADASVIAAEH